MTRIKRTNQEQHRKKNNVIATALSFPRPVLRSLRGNDKQIVTLKLKQFSIIFLLCLFTNNLLALSSDKHKIMHIQSDSAILNHKTGVNEYIGHVVVVQGTSHLTADRAWTFNDQHNQVYKMIALGESGDQAHYKTLPKVGQQEFYAQANLLFDYPNENKIKLVGSAYAHQAENSLKGPLIWYYTKTEQVVTPPSKNGKTYVVLNNTKKTKEMS